MDSRVEDVLWGRGRVARDKRRYHTISWSQRGAPVGYQLIGLPTGSPLHVTFQFIFVSLLARFLSGRQPWRRGRGLPGGERGTARSASRIDLPVSFSRQHRVIVIARLANRALYAPDLIMVMHQLLCLSPLHLLRVMTFLLRLRWELYCEVKSGGGAALWYSDNIPPFESLSRVEIWFRIPNKVCHHETVI